MQDRGRRRKRSDRGPRLTERDLLALRIIGEQYALRFDQLQVLLGQHAKAETLAPGVLSESATRHTIDRWELAELVMCKKILADQPGFCWLSKAGMYAAGLPFRQFEPSPSQLGHIYWCAQARLFLARQRPEWSWRSERWLRAELDQRIKSVKLPDALLQTEQGEVAIEIELTRKEMLKLTEVLRDRSMVYAQTWYFAPLEVAPAIEAARAQLESEYQPRVRVFNLEVITR